jgi:diguanylate cyclase (GGDEF)-like protein
MTKKMIFLIMFVLIFPMNISADNDYVYNNLEVIFNETLDQVNIEITELDLNTNEVNFLEELQSDEIIFKTTANVDPYMNSHGVGYEQFHVALLEKVLGLNIKLESFDPSEDLLEEIIEGDYDFILSLNRREVWDNYLLFSKIPYANANYAFISSNEDLNLIDKKQVKIGYPKGTGLFESLNQNGYENIVEIDFLGYKEAIETNEVDAFYLQYEYLLYNFDKNDNHFLYDTDHYMYDFLLSLATPYNKYPEMLTIFEKFYLNGGGEIINDFIYQSSNKIAELRSIEIVGAEVINSIETNELHVGYIESAPYFYTENGEYKGLLFELLEKFSHHYKFELVYEDLDVTTFEDIENLYKGKDYDILLNLPKSSLSYDEVDIKSPNQIVLVGYDEINNLQDLKTKKIGYYHSIDVKEFVEGSLLNESDLIFHVNDQQLIESLGANEIDYAIIGSRTFSYYSQIQNIDSKVITKFPEYLRDDAFILTSRSQAGRALNELFEVYFNLFFLKDQYYSWEKEVFNTNTLLNRNIELDRVTTQQTIIFFTLLMIIFSIALTFTLFRLRNLNKILNEDNLTGLNNKNKFLSSIFRSKNVVLFLFDVDKFNEVNVLYGQNGGDQILKQISVRLVEKFNSQNLYRLESDHFALLLRLNDDEFSKLKIKSVVSNLFDVFNEPFYYEDLQISLSCSIGIVLKSALDFTTMESIYSEARSAKLFAKDEASNSYNVSDESLYLELKDKLQLKEKMRHALEDGTIYPMYSPIYSLNTNLIKQIEVTPHLKVEDGKILKKNQFYNIAKENGMQIDIELMLIEKSLESLESVLPKLNRHHVSLSFLISEQTLGLMNPNTLDEIVSRFKLQKKLIFLKIDERLFANEDYVAKIHQLKSLGFNIVINHFTAGHLSLITISEFTDIYAYIFHEIIPKQFKAGEPETSIYHNVRGFLEDMNIKYVCKGISNRNQFDELRDKGVMYGQGEFIQTQVDTSHIIALIRNDTEIRRTIK